jgi:hypothetical protein
MVGTGEVDHELASEDEQELEKEKEKEREREKEKERERVDEGGEVSPNYKPAHISDELAALGYYARSMKPRKGWLSERESLLILDKIYLSTFIFRYYLRP